MCWYRLTTTDVEEREFEKRPSGFSPTLPPSLSPTAVLSEIATIGVAAGGAGLIVLVAVVMVLLCCVWNCARRSSTGCEERGSEGLLFHGRLNWGAPLII